MGGEKLQFRREMKQFCPYLLCYLARAAQINYTHLHRSIHYSSCKHISQMKCRRAPGFLISSTVDNAPCQLSQRAASSVLKKLLAIYGIRCRPPLLPIAASQEALM